MQGNNKAILVTNVSIAFIITAILEMTLHECAHFVAGLAVHTPSILFHNYVAHNSENATLANRIIVAGAGPVLSLLIGVLFALGLKSRKQADIIGLLMLYMSVFGYIGFFGYMAIAPFFSYGDTGFVLHALGCPAWLIATLAIVSVGLLYLSLKRLAPYFVSFMSRSTAETEKRGAFIFLLITVPFFIGTLITTLLNLPSPTPLSLIAPICSPFSIFWVYHDYRVAQPKGWGYDEEEKLSKKIPAAIIIGLLLIVALNRLLVYGFSIG